MIGSIFEEPVDLAEPCTSSPKHNTVVKVENVDVTPKKVKKKHAKLPKRTSRKLVR